MPVKPAKPLPVPIETGCYYELPVGTNTAQMKEYRLWAKISFGNYVTCVGRRLFFNFTCSKDRNDFLSAMEKTLKAKGTPVKRTYLQSL
ncbi:hypothetical protein [Fibrivirga algicola]|uniref:Uncharacterized protein n=1 Tax=Fibrivirga algicola TaxID=2950420 RepID=A0ABX0QE29_9BACT|nr:hypothetical protein [Fibrivirga algicola]NID09352.1 hypothetical protein [Fibrivirga algicola]